MYYALFIGYYYWGILKGLLSYILFKSNLSIWSEKLDLCNYLYLDNEKGNTLIFVSSDIKLSTNSS